MRFRFPGRLIRLQSSCNAAIKEPRSLSTVHQKSFILFSIKLAGKYGWFTCLQLQLAQTFFLCAVAACKIVKRKLKAYAQYFLVGPGQYSTCKIGLQCFTFPFFSLFIFYIHTGAQIK